METCRICLSSFKGESLLKLPCDCKGSIGFVHARCQIIEEIDYSKNKPGPPSCKVCNVPFPSGWLTAHRTFRSPSQQHFRVVGFLPPQDAPDTGLGFLLLQREMQGEAEEERTTMLPKVLGYLIALAYLTLGHALLEYNDIGLGCVNGTIALCLLGMAGLSVFDS